MPNRAYLSHHRGFTLVELLVGSSIFIIALISIIAVIRKGQELNTTDNHRRAAAAIIAAKFEGPTYDFINYANLNAGNATQNVVIDPRSNGTADDLNGTLTITIGAEQTKNGSSNIPVKYKPITMTVNWDELEERTN